jgi:fascin 1
LLIRSIFLQVAAMTGTNGVGETNGHTSATPEKGSWTIGLINSRYKYLSAETFGFRVNSNRTTMEKKQVWILEPYGDGDSICLRSHLNKYLAVDQFGNVTCENEEKNDTAKFEVSVCDDYSGRWAFRSLSRGYFLGASADNLTCAAKSPGDTELWYVHLAARPQVNLRSVGRKRFARLSDEKTEIQVEENVPWGVGILFSHWSSGRSRTSTRFTPAITCIWPEMVHSYPRLQRRPCLHVNTTEAILR